MDTTTIVVVAVAAFVVVVIGVRLFLARRRGDWSAPVPTRPSLSLGSAIRGAFSGKVDKTSWERLEEVLFSADVGVNAAAELIHRSRAHSPTSVEQAVDALRQELRQEFAGQRRALELGGTPGVVLVVGVNGSGKTTTIAKLAKRHLDQGLSVILGAGDTFRAAAGEQLRAWGDRLGVRVVVGQEGGDPASVAYDTLEAARSAGTDVVILDTAGRLHGKKNLMSELAKIYRVAGGDEVSEVLIVLDATAGQNGLAQVKAFSEVIDVTGVILSKLDGTARGGIVVAVERELGVPVKYVGTGEGIDDLVPFDPESFVDDLLEGA